MFYYSFSNCDDDSVGNTSQLVDISEYKKSHPEHIKIVNMFNTNFPQDWNDFTFEEAWPQNDPAPEQSATTSKKAASDTNKTKTPAPASSLIQIKNEKQDPPEQPLGPLNTNEVPLISSLPPTEVQTPVEPPAAAQPAIPWASEQAAASSASCAAPKSVNVKDKVSHQQIETPTSSRYLTAYLPISPELAGTYLEALSSASPSGPEKVPSAPLVVKSNPLVKKGNSSLCIIADACSLSSSSSRGNTISDASSDELLCRFYSL